MEEYKYLEPSSSSVIWLEVTKDIIKEKIRISGYLPDIIPKGSFTWTIEPITNLIEEKFYIIENNRYCANIKGSYFKIIDDPRKKKELSGEELLEEAKRRYPIGTKVKSLIDYNYIGKIYEHEDIISLKNEIWFKGYKKKDNDLDINLRVYNGGKWAKIIKEEVPVEVNDVKEFKENDYIVLLYDCTKNNVTSFVINRCYKQRKNSMYIAPYCDSHLNYFNEWTFISFNKKDYWRYATSEEIAEYNRLGKPYNVTTLNKNGSEITPIIGKWYHITAFNNLEYYIKYKTGYYSCNYIVPGEKYHTFGTFDNVEIIKELSLDEIQHYLPDNHIDKIKTNNFKEGDWVIGWYEKSSSGYDKKAWQISQIIGEYVYVKDSPNHNTYLSSIRYATAREVADAMGIQGVESSKKLTHKNLIEEEYYYTRYDTKCDYIFKFYKDGNSRYIMPDSDTYVHYGNFDSPNINSTLRLATQEEKDWLDACINANEFVPKISIVNSHCSDIFDEDLMNKLVNYQPKPNKNRGGIYKLLEEYNRIKTTVKTDYIIDHISQFPPASFNKEPDIYISKESSTIDNKILNPNTFFVDLYIPKKTNYL